MARGICLNVKNQSVRSVRVDYGDVMNDLDKEYYDSQGYQPDWRTLPACDGSEPLPNGIGVNPSPRRRVERRPFKKKEPVSTDINDKYYFK